MATKDEEAAIKAAQERVVGDNAAAKARADADARAKNRKPLEVEGRVGGAFNIRGEDFGSSGTLMIGDRVLIPNSWADKVIKGQLPADLPPGKIVVRSALGEQTGTYPTPAKPTVLPAAVK